MVFLFFYYRLFGLLGTLLLFGNKDEARLCCSMILLLMDSKLFRFCMMERLYNWWLILMSTLGHLLILINRCRLSFLLRLKVLCLASNERGNSYFFTSPLIKLNLKLFLQIFLKALTTINHTLLEEIHSFLLATKYIIKISKHDLCYINSFCCICNISERWLF
jgi:hypothetical protein